MHSGHTNNSVVMAEPVDISRNGWEEMIKRYRLLEFACSFAMMGIAMVFALIEVHQRDISNIEVRISATTTIWARDPALNQKQLDEHVPMVMLSVGGVGIPILTNLFVNYALPKFKRVRVIPHDTRDFLLSLAQSVGVSQLLTQFIKNMTGRFRPCFYEMCDWDYETVWDGVTNLCRDKHGEKEARKSFPSGHSSFAWATLFLLTLYLMGRSRLNVVNRSETVLRGGRKTLKLFFCLLPSLIATWVAVTRSLDNWHNYSDILAGSLIGMFAALLGYNYNYGGIFCPESAGVPFQEVHTQRKKKREHDRIDRAARKEGTGQAPPSRALSTMSTKSDFSISIQ